MNKLPADIEILMTEEGVYIEIEGFIRFLKNDTDIPEEYKKESIHLKKIAEYLESQLAEAILHRNLLHGQFNQDKPN